MNTRVQIFALAGIIMHMSIVSVVKGQKPLMQEKVRHEKKLVNIESKEDKQQKTLSKKTHEKLKSAREQYKKQLTRLIDLLTQAHELGRGIEESEVTTKDLKDFFGSLGSMYTSVVDTITGAGELKKKISELERSNTQLLALIQVLKAQLDQQNLDEKKLQEALDDQKNKTNIALKYTAQLEAEKKLWLDYLNRLESCVVASESSKNQSQGVCEFVGEILTSTYQAAFPGDVPKS